VKEEIRVFAEKARKFEDAARYFAEKGVYDLAGFHIEQALQLYIKFILAKGGSARFSSEYLFSSARRCTC
jgi:HEPN domain-containing protein